MRSRTRRVEWTADLEQELGEMLGRHGVFVVEPSAPIEVDNVNDMERDEMPPDNDLQYVA